MSSRAEIEVDEIVFTVWYDVYPAEPDVGIMYPYLEVDVEGPMGIEITDDIMDSVRTQLYWNLDL